jgi:hypothetical protein|uniref:Uncharacterized protein n=1 Tax=Picea glauca TaxID=3330 RepID=A0A117NG24_PICGL|nr:hypothetical protein ABT39_MTgene1979 [Picea glauca]QHR88015.1 hypothetical protein Q903MT_gene2027 [Picea sitchensis]
MRPTKAFPKTRNSLNCTIRYIIKVMTTKEKIQLKPWMGETIPMKWKGTSHITAKNTMEFS